MNGDTLEMETKKKADFIQKLARDFIVLAEVGSKDANIVAEASLWVEEIRTFLQAGAWKVIAEARESGTVGLYNKSGEIRPELVNQIMANFNLSDLIFEAPQKSQQVWFLKQFGPSVNLGNIATHDVISLETLRLGLREDTMTEFQIKKFNDMDDNR